MTICTFTGQYRFLSNFWPCAVEFEGVVYPSAEHAFQAAKAPPGRRAKFLAGTPGEAKRRGRELPLPADWPERKRTVMHAVVLDKFTRHADLATYEGENHLGHILMEVREMWLEAIREERLGGIIT